MTSPIDRVSSAEHEMLARPRSRHGRRSVIRALVAAWGAADLAGALIDAGVLQPGRYLGDRPVTAPPSTVADLDSGFHLTAAAREVWPGGGVVNLDPVLPRAGCATCLEARCQGCWPPSTLDELRPCDCECHRLPERVRDVGFLDVEQAAAP